MPDPSSRGVWAGPGSLLGLHRWAWNGWRTHSNRQSVGSVTSFRIRLPSRRGTSEVSGGHTEAPRMGTLERASWLLPILALPGAGGQYPLARVFNVSLSMSAGPKTGLQDKCDSVPVHAVLRVGLVPCLPGTHSWLPRPQFRAARGVACTCSANRPAPGWLSAGRH